jgi:hypothetical protein
MKHQTLRIIASLLDKLAWLVAAAGIIISIIIGIAAATVATKVGILLGGLVLTAVNALMLLAVSKLVYLFISIDESLERIAFLKEKEQGSTGH